MPSLIASTGQKRFAGTPEQFSAWIRSEIARWGKVVRATGARAD
ncbi:MAG TPA: hypothetical protein VMK05_02835 [Burkholderiales bacterium]|nr:hypothetical protein [Burkholderiales bacterium]